MMAILTYRLELLEPVLIRQVAGGDPNSGVGYPYIPGSAVRGALIGRYGGSKDAGDERFRRLFLDGRVRFLHAYPASSADRRALPTPLSWEAKKDEDPLAEVFDVVRALPGVLPSERKSMSGAFCDVHFDSEDATTSTRLITPATQINIHTARANRQSTTAEGATVFRYDSLAAGQTLIGAIVADDDKDLDELKSLLAGAATLLIGGSHTAGYGLVNIALDIEDGDAADEPFQEYQPLERPSQPIVVTLLSDTIVRDPRTGAAAAHLRPVIDVKPSLVRARTTVIGGFNRTWNLPLPQEWAIRAGSVFVYPYDQALLTRLRELEQTGIGERRAEGYGRIAVNWVSAAQIKISENSDGYLLAEDLVGEDRALAQQMVNRMLRAQMDQKLPGAINKWRPDRNTLQNSQISALRLVVRRGLTEGNLGVIPDYLEQMKKTGRDQVERARVGSQRLSAWLTSRANNPGGIWTDLGITTYPTIGDVTADKSADLEVEYTARLMDGVLRRFAKQEGL